MRDVREVLDFNGLIEVDNVYKLYLRQDRTITVHLFFLSMDPSTKFFDSQIVHLILFNGRILKEA